MNRYIFLSVLMLSGFLQKNEAQNSATEKGMNAINRNVLQSQLEFLASDWMEGRKAGERGEIMAADYIAGMLKLYGIKPAGDRLIYNNLTNDPSPDDRSWYQSFMIIRRVPGNDQKLNLITEEGGIKKVSNLTYGVNYSFEPSAAFEITAPVIFAGYGLRNERLGINELADIDYNGKFIMVVSGIPEFAQSKLSPAEIVTARRNLEQVARKGGASGIIEIRTIAGNPADIKDLAPAENQPVHADDQAKWFEAGRESNDTFARIVISLQAAREFLKGTGTNLDEYLRKADAGEAFKFNPLPGKYVYLKSDVNESIVHVRNVIGRIEGTKPDEIIILGAHYDHVGTNAGYIWNGADDNGSGTVGVMTLAKALMETGKKPEKTIVIALWTAEEVGLIGSEFFIHNLEFPAKNIKLNVNFDMISRYISDDQPNKVTMTYTSSCKGFRSLTESNIKKYGIALDIDFQPSDDPPGGTDHRTFVAAGVPVMRFKPGHREEYHTPFDETSTIDWDIMEKIVRISFANVWELANSEW